MKNRSVSPTRSFRPRRAASFAPVLLLALVAAEAVLVLTYQHQGRAVAQAIHPFQRSYFQNGQWLADVRTLSAAARYLFQSESPWPGTSGWTGAAPALRLPSASFREPAPERSAHTS